MFIYQRDKSIRWEILEPIHSELLMTPSAISSKADNRELMRLDANSNPVAQVISEIFFAVLTADWEKLSPYFELSACLASLKHDGGILMSAVSKLIDSDDGELVACLREGADECYEELLRRYGPGVLSTAKRYLRSDADAHDCFQETFLAVFEGIDKFEQRSSISTWVRRIAINQCLMRIRAHGRRHEESIDHLLPVFDQNGERVCSSASKNVTTASDPIDRARTKIIVREKINELPDSYRVMLLLRDIDGYSTKEAAAIQRISVSNAKTQLHRARAALRSLLEPVMEHLDYHADM